MKELLIIGGGRMGTALLDGLLASQWVSPDECAVVEPSEDRRAELRRDHPDIEVTNTMLEARGAVLATKPAQVTQVAREADDAGVARLVSIAAGVRLATIEAEVSDHCAVVRAMPNTPALIGAGVTAIAGGTNADHDTIDWATGLLQAIGTVVEVDEAKLDAVTGLSGSGPAYVFLVAEALIDAGVLNGLDRQTASLLATRTLLGASRLLVESGDEAPELRAAVTSPGGTTAAGLAELERAGVRAAFLEAVTAATRRSTELG